MFTWPLKRGCYQPRSRCMFAFALGRRLARTRVHARTHKGALLNSDAPTPSPARPGRRACLCQQMSGRRCVFLCLSLRSFHLLLQRLPICLRPRFISSHSSPHTPPPSPPPPTTTPEDSGGSVVFQTLWHCLFRKHDPAFRSRRFLPRHPKDEPSQNRRRYCSLTRAVLSSKTHLDRPLIAAPSAVLSSKVIPATCRARARTRSALSCLQRANLDFPIYVLFNASLPTLMTSAE